MLLRTEIAAVPIDDFFLPGQKFRHHRDVADVGGSYLYILDKAAVLVHADMCFIPKVPLIPLFRLVRVRIALLLPILNRRRRFD